ncbi:two-component system, NarL family, sensor histidine kinase DegS [Candidatus Hakubella thermalkaliphila]|nr:two-component system, NarL family, sensor histidine kinase DegS [Candidatus Hakubella thermalkaliphila]
MLAHLVPILQKLQDGFARTLNVTLLTVDPEGNPITRISNPSDFCTLIMGNPSGNARCQLSHKEMAVAVLKTGKPAVHRYCHAGLIQFAAPVIVEGSPLGTVLAGVPPSIPLDVDRVNRLADELGIMRGSLLAAAKSMKGLPEETIPNAVDFLCSLARTIAELCYQRDELSTWVVGLSTLYEVGKAISSTLSLREILDVTTERAISVTKAETGSIMLLDEKKGELSIETACGLDHKAVKQVRTKLGEGIAGWVAQQGEPVLLVDLATDPRFKDVSQREEIRSALSVPLKVKDKVIGVLNVNNKLVGGPFNEDDLALVSALASEIAIAIENARLYEETKQKVMELSALHDVAKSTASTLKLEKLLALIIEKTAQVLHVPMCALKLIDKKTEELTVMASSGLTKEYIEGLRSRVGEGITGWVAKEGKPLAVSDVTKDSRYRYLGAAKRGHIRAMLCVPLIIRKGTIGVLSVYAPSPHYYTDDEVNLLSTLASQTAIAIENARLYEEISYQRGALEQLMAKTIQTQEDERKIVGLEVHDVISQAIASLFYRIQTCERLLDLDVKRAREEFSEMKRMAQGTLDDVTRLMFNLRPPHLEDLGVFPALRRYVDQYQRENAISVEMEVKGRRKRFHPSVEITIYRIVQEALTNVRKHAEARRVALKFEVNQETIHGLIEDNGKGFNPNPFLTKGEAEGHLGLLGMKERATLLGGTLDVKSSPGKGTAVCFEIPALSRQRK